MDVNVEWLQYLVEDFLSVLSGIGYRDKRLRFACIWFEDALHMSKKHHQVRCTLTS